MDYMRFHRAGMALIWAIWRVCRIYEADSRFFPTKIQAFPDGFMSLESRYLKIGAEYNRINITKHTTYRKANGSAASNKPVFFVF
jgi:hypothetical protein